MAERKLNLRLSDEELAQLHALAEEEERSANAWLRRTVRERYRARFDALPKKRRARNDNAKGAR